MEDPISPESFALSYDGLWGRECAHPVRAKKRKKTRQESKVARAKEKKVELNFKKCHIRKNKNSFTRL